MPNWLKSTLLWVLIGPPVFTLAIALAGAFAFIWATPFIWAYQLIFNG